MSDATGDRFRRLRVGVAARTSSGDDALGADLGAFAAALGARLGIVVTGHPFAHYADLLDAMHDGDVDLGWLPPVVAVRAQARGRTLPIALPVRDGASTFFGALFASSGSAIRAANDLAGARVAWVDRQSAAGYLVVRASLRAQGVDLERAFASESFLGSHAAVVDAVIRGAADVGATFAYTEPNAAVKRAGWGRADVRVLGLAGPIPCDVLAASIGVPVALIRAVQRAIGPEATPELRAASRPLLDTDTFVEARPEHLDPLCALLSHMAEERPLTIPPPPG
jgi:phosphonate transport system substrate-binding protein